MITNFIYVFRITLHRTLQEYRIPWRISIIYFYSVLGTLHYVNLIILQQQGISDFGIDRIKSINRTVINIKSYFRDQSHYYMIVSCLIFKSSY